jgi:hypothetical protein
MTDLYLIAHRVRGEPAFDVATRMECPECAAQGCNECDDSGFWWIIPTSGHRAYPFFSCDLPAMMENHPDVGWEIRYGNLFPGAEYVRIGLLPDVPDHYMTREAPSRSLADLLGITNRKPKSASTTPFPRRI